MDVIGPLCHITSELVRDPYEGTRVNWSTQRIMVVDMLTLLPKVPAHNTGEWRDMVIELSCAMLQEALGGEKISQRVKF
jgi:hypothetical protein